jgi:hypothetical protein
MTLPLKRIVLREVCLLIVETELCSEP